MRRSGNNDDSLRHPPWWGALQRDLEVSQKERHWSKGKEGFRGRHRGTGDLPAEAGARADAWSVCGEEGKDAEIHRECRDVVEDGTVSAEHSPSVGTSAAGPVLPGGISQKHGSWCMSAAHIFLLSLIKTAKK